MWSSSLLCLMVRPHRASSGQIYDNRAVFRNGEQPFSSASPEWSVSGVCTDRGLPGVPEEPPAPAGAQLDARQGLAPLILRQGSHWQLPGRACMLLPWHASPSSTGEPRAGTFGSSGAKCHPMQGCRSSLWEHRNPSAMPCPVAACGRRWAPGEREAEGWFPC